MIINIKDVCDKYIKNVSPNKDNIYILPKEEFNNLSQELKQFERKTFIEKTEKTVSGKSPLCSIMVYGKTISYEY